MGAFSLRAATGLIGSVYSNVYGVPPAEVEVMDEADPSKRFTGRTDYDGIFRFPDLPPGRYSIGVRAAYFHDPTIHSVRIQAGTLTDVGRIRLMAPCEESPGTACFVLHSPAGEISEGGGQIEMSDLCAVHLDERQPWCPGTRVMPGPFSSNDLLPDFRFQVANDGVWLVPLNDVWFSLNPTTMTYERGCPNATYAPGPIRIDNLPRN